MNKIIKKFTILPLILLVGCTQKGVELDETQAKEQLSAMKAEIEKDDFVIPTKITLKTEAAEKEDGKTVETYNTDFRFNSEVGSRYLYLKTENIKTTTTETVTLTIYEKDSKYYYYSCASDTTTSKECSETEFKTLFNEAVENFDFSPAEYKKGLVNYIEMAAGFYTINTTNANLEIKFTKYNESTFTCNVDYSKEGLEEKTTIKFENYLFTFLEHSAYYESTKSEEYMKGTVTYNTIDYIYPDK